MTIRAAAPSFFGVDNNAGIMVLQISQDSCEHGEYVYSTDDGGMSWQFVGASDSPIKSYSFVDSCSGVGLDEQGLLYRTQDGGIEWELANR